MPSNTPASKPKDWTSQDVLRALQRASEKARLLAEQTSTPFVVRRSASHSLVNDKQEASVQAIDFASKVHDGVVDLPLKHQSWNGKEVWVILQEAASEEVKHRPLFKAASISTSGYRFSRDEANE